MGGLIKASIAWSVKFTLLAVTLFLLFIPAIMLKYDVSASYVLTQSDRTIEDDLSQYLQPNAIAWDIAQSAPIFCSHLPVISRMDWVEQATSAGMSVASAYVDDQNVYQRELFKEMFFSVTSLAVFEVLFFLYGLIRKIVDKIYRKRFFSFLLDLISVAEIVYVGTILSLLYRDYFIRRFFDRNPFLSFFVLILAVFAVSFLKSLIKRDRSKSFLVCVGDAALDLLKGMLLLAMIFGAVLSFSILASGGAEGRDLTVAVACAVVFLLGAEVLGIWMIAKSTEKE